jgi:hypothetical protein
MTQDANKIRVLSSQKLAQLNSRRERVGKVVCKKAGRERTRLIREQSLADQGA